MPSSGTAWAGAQVSSGPGATRVCVWVPACPDVTAVVGVMGRGVGAAPAESWARSWFLGPELELQLESLAGLQLGVPRLRPKQGRRGLGEAPFALRFGEVEVPNLGL